LPRYTAEAYHLLLNDNLPSFAPAVCPLRWTASKYGLEITFFCDIVRYPQLTGFIKGGEFELGRRMVLYNRATSLLPVFDARLERTC